MTLKKIFSTKPDGARSVEGPKLRWEDGVDQDMGISGVKNWKKVALNRDEWAKLLKKARAHQGLSSQWWWIRKLSFNFTRLRSIEPSDRLSFPVISDVHFPNHFDQFCIPPILSSSTYRSLFSNCESSLARNWPFFSILVLCLRMSGDTPPLSRIP